MFFSILMYLANTFERYQKISKKLRTERELAFYGDIDFIPTEEYTSEDSREARKDAQWIVGVAKKVIVLE